MLLVLVSAYLSGIPLVKRYTDPRSELIVASEVNDAASWLKNVITRALWTGSDFKLTVAYAKAEPRLSVTWESTGLREEWRAPRIAFKSLETDNALHSYSSRFQTISPALSIRVYHGDNKADRTDWMISISAYGFVRTYRKT
jgi:hypothetical protein